MMNKYYTLNSTPANHSFLMSVGNDQTTMNVKKVM